MFTLTQNLNVSFLQDLLGISSVGRSVQELHDMSKAEKAEKDVFCK